VSELLRALAGLEARSAFLFELLERMVRINSFTQNVAGVDAAGALLREALAVDALQLSTRPGTGVGAHLCFSTPAADQQPAVLLVGHHDTVFPPGSFEGFSREEDLVRGPGVLDMKGGLALVAATLRALDDAGLLAALPLRFISVSDEEIGSPSSRPWLEQLAAGARCALVFEAGRASDAIITARRGVGHARLTAHGKAAHAGNALAEGANAIWALARCIDALERESGSIPGASLNVGLVRGGSARNTVPELASCELDLRFRDAAGQTRLLSLLEQVCKDSGLAVAGTRVELEVAVARKPWVRTQAAAALCAQYGTCQQAAGLLWSEAQTIGGGSDANTIGASGVPTIDGLGPRGSGFHTHDEYALVSSFLPKAEALLRFLLAPFRADQKSERA
jgi:glutamate carboxypeptidase